VALVRGFGPGYKPGDAPTAAARADREHASIGQGPEQADFVSGTTRSFEFSNIASKA
jgi:hypothetical protein